jgi:hypothetical protein
MLLVSKAYSTVLNGCYRSRFVMCFLIVIYLGLAELKSLFGFKTTL